MKPVIRTFTGKIINPFELSESDIDIEDIAHSLSLINRFNGHTRFPMNVAQHSLAVSKLCHPKFALQGLLHDAAEAYTGDVSKWIKGTPEFAAFREIEDHNQWLIYKKFGCSTDQHETVSLADRQMVLFEGQQGFGKDFVVNHPDYTPLSSDEIGWIQNAVIWVAGEHWKASTYRFLTQFEYLVP